MTKRTFSFGEMGLGSKLIRDFIDQSVKTLPFSGSFFSLEEIKDKAGTNGFSIERRELLCKVLEEQNGHLELSDLTKSNITAINRENTFTITTGHQLNLWTGPLFSIIKIAQTIAITQHLNDKFAEFHFVPVFWMAAEDHDFEEINHIHLFGEKIEWNKKGQENVVAGRIKTEGMDPFFDAILSKYHDESKQAEIRKFIEHYTSNDNLAKATRSLINELFGEFGLVIIDGDDPELKNELAPVIVKELTDEVTFDEVSRTNEKLVESGYHNQVHVRQCNLFYIHDDGTRERIIKVSEGFEIDKKALTKEELLEEARNHPEKFSPNALLRPVYQEIILPNLVYLGGGGEIAYWLQLKSTFEAFGVNFPYLIVRDSMIFLKQKQIAELEATGIDIPSLKDDINLVLKKYVIEKSESELQLTDAEATLMKAKSQVLSKIHQVDKSLEPMAEAEFVRMIKAIEKIEAKLIKAEKNKFNQTENRLIRLQETIFPNGGFQERYENVIPYLLNDRDFIRKIIGSFDEIEKAKVHLAEIA